MCSGIGNILTEIISENDPMLLSVANSLSLSLSLSLCLSKTDISSFWYTPCMGVAMEWTGVDMSTLFFPEVRVPGIDSDLVSFMGRSRSGLLDPAGGSASRPPLEAWTVVHPQFLDLATPCTLYPANLR